MELKQKCDLGKNPDTEPEWFSYRCFKARNETTGKYYTITRELSEMAFENEFLEEHEMSGEERIYIVSFVCDFTKEIHSCLYSEELIREILNTGRWKITRVSIY